MYRASPARDGSGIPRPPSCWVVMARLASMPNRACEAASACDPRPTGSYNGMYPVHACHWGMATRVPVSLGRQIMQQGIHPDYHAVQVTCSCGNTFVTKSTAKGDHMTVDVLEVPPVLHRQAEDSRHRWPRGSLREALRQEEQLILPRGMNNASLRAGVVHMCWHMPPYLMPHGSMRSSCQLSQKSCSARDFARLASVCDRNPAYAT